MEIRKNMKDDYLRRLCRELKCFQQISYKEQAELLEMKACSFYAWLRGSYSFSAERKQILYSIIQDLYSAE